MTVSVSSHLSQQSDRLVIVAGCDISPTNCQHLGSADILALSLPAMITLEELSKDFFTLEDFHPHLECYADTNSMAVAHRQWLNDCDRICQQQFGVPRAFTANGFWFLHRFSDLRYLHRVLDSISQRYKEIELWAGGGGGVLFLIKK
ncbi:MAG: hypothetical protein OEY01_06635 [Desulfobulbaceae bacterium]|nr:hypothetical protein [Desulfobulbaceae bacterium]